MNYLNEFEQKISLLDGMLIETGGKFGENELENYINSCMQTVDRYYQEHKEKRELIKIVASYILQYKNEISWKYYNYQMKFLYTLKAHIEQL